MTSPVDRPAGLYEVLEPHLATARLTPYLAAVDGNRRQAIRLYQWNIALSGAVYEALHVVEVVLRNAIDAQLCVWNADQTNTRTGKARDRDWLLDPAPLLRRLVREQELTKARQRAEQAIRRHRRPVAHADLLAQLSFGTWRFLLPDRDPGRQRLWNDSLHAAFPHLNRPPRELVKSVHGIYQLRNRVAHLETAPTLRQRPGPIHQHAYCPRRDRSHRRRAGSSPTSASPPPSAHARRPTNSRAAGPA